MATATKAAKAKTSGWGPKDVGAMRKHVDGINSLLTKFEANGGGANPKPPKPSARSGTKT